MTAIQILNRLGIEYEEHVPMAQYTTFRIGGPADIVVYPADADEVSRVIRAFAEQGISWLALGNGSNLLVADAGIRRPVIRTSRMKQLTCSGTAVYCGAGLSLAKVSNFACECSLAGLEFLHGIPGSVGGAIRMNAGAYGGEIAQVATQTVYVDACGEKRIAYGAEQQFRYRHSAFEHGVLVCGAVLQGRIGNRDEISRLTADLDHRRREKQPLEYPSAGSTFKRPGGYFAGALIEQCALKGVRIGGAQVSEKHAGFIINTGNATAADVLRLIEHVQTVVLRETGVLLEPEVQYLSE